MNSPRAYRDGTVNFYGYDLKVTPATLIPRPETEQLVEQTLELAKRYLRQNISVLDIGTGSGAIAVTLKKLRPNWSVTASDISPDALEIAKQNADTHHAQINFKHGDMFKHITGQFDLVIANLPYVPAPRWRWLDRSVTAHEPKSAIVAGRDGLKLIKQFCETVGPHLKKVSVVALEIDDTHGQRVQALLQQALPNHQCYSQKDWAGRDRFCFAVPK